MTVSLSVEEIVPHLSPLEPFHGTLVGKLAFYDGILRFCGKNECIEIHDETVIERLRKETTVESKPSHNAFIMGKVIKQDNGTTQYEYIREIQLLDDNEPMVVLEFS